METSVANTLPDEVPLMQRMFYFQYERDWVRNL